MGCKWTIYFVVGDCSPAFDRSRARVMLQIRTRIPGPDWLALESHYRLIENGAWRPEFASANALRAKPF